MSKSVDLDPKADRETTMESVGALFDNLGRTLEAQWARVNFNLSSFPEIARDELLRSNILNKVAPRDIFAWMFEAKTVPEQNLRAFGQPPINVFMSEHFYIEVLTWMDSSNAIHEHAFAGAFGLLRGRSLHISYDFDEQTRCPGLSFGSLEVASCDLIGSGHVEAIPPGSSLVHVNLHLEQPTLTIVVRTKALRQYSPQRRFYRPGLAWDESFKHEPVDTKLALLRSLQRIDREAFWIGCHSMVEDCDQWTAFKLLDLLKSNNAIDTSREQEHVKQKLQKRFRFEFPFISNAATIRAWERSMIARIQAAESADAREALAIVLVSPDQQVGTDILKRRFSDYPLPLDTLTFQPKTSCDAD